MTDEYTQEGEHHHLIVGIDYGTTYSGVAFALSSSDTEYNEVQSVERWPSVKGRRREDKAPTEIAYGALKSSNGISKTAWGYQIKPYTTRCAWIKLHLDNHSIPSRYDDPKLQVEIRNAAANFPYGKTAQDVTSDYLKELYACTMAKLDQTFGRELMAITKIKFWFTMPAIWSDEAQARTRQAAVTAKFGTRPGDEICMIKEPEAAALATLNRTTMDWNNSVNLGEGVVVVDCGGGTIDLTSYEVTQFHPKLNLREVCAGIGAKRGATCMERNLHDLMSTYFGEAFDSIRESKASVGSKFMEDFEYNKRLFGAEGAVLRPMNLFLDGEPDPEHYSANGKVILKEGDMVKIFEPIIKVILQLVEQQINSAKGVKISHLVLVGGFGDSPYLKNRLREWCNLRSIMLKAPGNSWNAVAKGAVLRGLGQASVNERLCRRHYGIESGRPYEQGVNQPDYLDPFTGQWWSMGYMMWHIRKGEEIMDELSKPLSFFRIIGTDDRELTTTIYYSDLDQAPEKSADPGIQPVGEYISADLTQVDMTKFTTIGTGSDRQIKLLFTIEVVIGERRGTLRFKVRINEKVVGEADIEFSKD